eukprot:3306679-Prymnesium_polylepis.1
MTEEEWCVAARARVCAALVCAPRAWDGGAGGIKPSVLVRRPPAGRCFRSSGQRRWRASRSDGSSAPSSDAESHAVLRASFPRAPPPRRSAVWRDARGFESRLQIFWLSAARRVGQKTAWAAAHWNFPDARAGACGEHFRRIARSQRTRLSACPPPRPSAPNAEHHRGGASTAA